MSFHRNQALFQRARWRRRLLVPAWSAQAALLLAIVAVFSYRLAHTVDHFADDRAAGNTPTVELVWESTNVGLALLGLALTGFEAHRLHAETLTPFFLLACNVIKMTAALAILALDIVVYTQRTNGNWSSVGLALDAAALAAMLALGVYSIVAFRRLAGADDDDDSRTKAYGMSGLVANGAAMGMGSVPNRASADYRAYNHERDTQFDAYLGAAGVGTGRALSKNAIDSALGAELWGAPTAGSAARPMSDGAAAAAVDRSNSLVGTGVVAAVTPHREATHRTVSWTVEHGVAAGSAGSMGTPMILEQDEEDYMAHNPAREPEKNTLLRSHEREAAGHEDV